MLRKDNVGYMFNVGQMVEVRRVFKSHPEYNGAVGRVIKRWEVEPFFPGEPVDNRYLLKFENEEMRTFEEESLRRCPAW